MVQGHVTTPVPLDPLGVTGEGFATAHKAAGILSWHAALNAYRHVLRTGRDPLGRVAAGVSPIVRTLREECSEGEVIKFTQRVGNHTQADANAQRPREVETESVLIPMIGRSGRSTYTLCVSSQIGCAMGCGFCETAQMGLIRSLTPGEIVGQWFAATHLVGKRPKNIVFMGMGEPLDNYDNVIAAIEILTDHNGAAVPINKITISTVGRLDGLAKLRERIHLPGWHRLNLAVSLNAPTDQIRSQIMPVNRGMPMASLRAMLEEWPIYGGAKLCVEYVLIPGVNDAPEHASQIAEFIRPIDNAYKARTRGTSPRCVVNLIPYNPRRDSPWPAPEEDHVDRFLSWLGEAGLYAKRRRTKGRRMMGACGQLGSEAIRGRKVVPLTISE